MHLGFRHDRGLAPWRLTVSPLTDIYIDTRVLIEALFDDHRARVSGGRRAGCRGGV